MHERVAGSRARKSTHGVRSTQARTVARFASERATSPASPPAPSAQASPSSASSTQSIEGVLIVAPSKIDPSSFPFLVSRKIFGSGRGGVNDSRRATARGDSASMPCAASPPSTFCHDQVTTSSLSHATSIAKTAEVASQSTSPARSRGIQSAFGTRTPDVVPFQVKITSRAKSTLARSGSAPYSAASTRASSCNCFVTSVTHSWPKLSQASTSTGRSPSSDHIAISIAPVSEAGTMPSFQSAGMPSNARERSITACKRCFGALARCERPSSAPASASSDQPGRFAHGPEEN